MPAFLKSHHGCSGMQVSSQPGLMLNWQVAVWETAGHHSWCEGRSWLEAGANKGVNINKGVNQKVKYTTRKWIMGEECQKIMKKETDLQTAVVLSQIKAEIAK